MESGVRVGEGSFLFNGWGSGVCLRDLHSTIGICETGQCEVIQRLCEGNGLARGVLASRTSFKLTLVGLLSTVAALRTCHNCW